MCLLRVLTYAQGSVYAEYANAFRAHITDLLNTAVGKKALTPSEREERRLRRLQAVSAADDDDEDDDDEEEEEEESEQETRATRGRGRPTKKESTHKESSSARKRRYEDEL
jgi:hypothetical protein